MTADKKLKEMSEATKADIHMTKCEQLQQGRPSR